jgi:uncharacterized membrane protein
MIHVEINVEIGAPPDRVFAFISNFENNPKWQGGMIEAHLTSVGALQAGSTYSQTAHFLGRQIESRFEVLEFEPGRLVKASTVASTFPITFTRIVDPCPEGSAVTAIVEGDATGLLKLAEPLMARKVRKSIANDYSTLKKLLENN